MGSTLFSIGTLISILNVIVFPFVFYYSMSERAFHKNFKIIWFCIGLSLAGFSITYLIIIMMDNFCVNCQKETTYIIFSNAQSFFHRAERIMLLALFGERLFATIFFETYETKGSILVPFTLITFSYILSLSWLICSTKGILSDYATVYMHLFALIISFSGLIVLYIQNSQMSQKINRQLTERYQLKENVNATNLLLPCIFIGNALESIGIVFILKALYGNAKNKRDSLTIFYMSMIIQPTIWILIFLIRRKKKRAVIQVSPDDKQITLKKESDDYFMNLKNSWK